jgi:hypothetical protein
MGIIHILRNIWNYFCSDLVPLQSNFFPAKFFFCILEKGNLAGKNLLGKDGFSFLEFFENLQKISMEFCSSIGLLR